MARIQSQIEQVTGSIASLRTILEDYPKLGKITITPASAIELLLEILRLFGVPMQDVLNWISRLLSGELLTEKINIAVSNGLDKAQQKIDEKEEKTDEGNGDGILYYIEMAIKSVLLANFQGMFSCNVNPFLPDDLMLSSTVENELNIGTSADDRTSGMRLSIDGIDLFGILRNAPTSKEGKGFYFDATKRFINRQRDGLTPNSLYQSFDFNAFLWYIINKENDFNTKIGRQRCTWDNRVNYYKIFKKNNDLWDKFMGYSQDGSSPTIDDYCTEVFDTNKKMYRPHEISANDDIVKKKGIIICRYDESPADVKDGENLRIWLNAERYYHTRKIWGSKCNLYEKFDELKNIRGNDGFQKGDAYKSNDTICLFTGYNDKKNKTGENWISINQEDFYINKTIYEFNYDFIYSLKLFDSKVLVASILNSIMATLRGVAFNVNLTIEQKAAMLKIEQMISDTIELDDQEIDNSSFNFSNEKYDILLEQAYQSHGSQYDETLIEDTRKRLEEIDDAATYDEQITAISNAISAFTYNVASYEGENSVNIGANIGGIPNMDIFKVLIKQIVVDIVMQVLTPKVVVLYAVNSYVMGGDFDKQFKIPDWDAFLKSWTNLVIQLTKQIKDIILKELYNWVISKISPLIKLFVEKLILESIGYYRDLIVQLIENCVMIPTFRNGDNTVIDNVNYADIIPPKTSPES